MSIHIYGPNKSNSKRTRAWCPWHKKMCYGKAVAYYDTINLYLDCKTAISLGYGYWDPPPQGPRGGRGSKGRRRPIRQQDWEHWKNHLKWGLDLVLDQMGIK